MWLYALPFPREEETLEFLVKLPKCSTLATDTTISLGRGSGRQTQPVSVSLGRRAASLNP